MILLERAPAAVRNQTNDGGFSAYVLPLGNVEKNNGQAPWGDAPIARLTVSASHSLLLSSALHSMAVTGPFRHAKRASACGSPIAQPPLS